ncbi:N-acetyl-beta-D-galactosaminidase [Aureococcus anophagefferens]|nr:N-acetyl-beta-D-galactosaminidase [Aureococcus anophagefferens]
MAITTAVTNRIAVAARAEESAQQRRGVRFEGEGSERSLRSGSPGRPTFSPGRLSMLSPGSARRLSLAAFTRTTLVMPSPFQIAAATMLTRVRRTRSAGGSSFAIIDPMSPRLQAFEAFCLVMTMITAFTTPFEMAFVPALRPPLKSNGFFLTNRCLDAVFFVDFWLRFLCVPYRSGTRANHFVKERRLIARHYARTWMLPDLIALVPFDLLTYEPFNIHLSSVVVTALRLLRLVRMLKLGRVVTLVERWSEASSVPYAYIEICKLMSFIFMTVHWVACAWGLLGELEAGDHFSWVDALRSGMASTCESQDAHDAILVYLQSHQGTPQATYLADKISVAKESYRDSFHRPSCEKFDTRRSKYVVSLYFAVYTLTGIGYGDVNAHPARFRGAMDDLNSMLSESDLDPELCVRVRDYFSHSRNLMRTRDYHELDALMSAGLRGEVAGVVSETWLEKVWYFRNSSKAFMRELSMLMGPLMFAPFETVDAGASLLIIQRGLVMLGGRMLTRGDHVGHEFIVVRDEERVALDAERGVVDSRVSPSAFTYVEVLELRQEDLLALFPLFPEEAARVTTASRWLVMKIALLKWAKAKLARERADAQRAPGTAPAGGAAAPAAVAAVARGTAVLSDGVFGGSRPSPGASTAASSAGADRGPATAAPRGSGPASRGSRGSSANREIEQLARLADDDEPRPGATPTLLRCGSPRATASRLSAAAPEGALRALASLGQLWRWDGARHALPSAFDVEDAPRHAWRGLLLDTSRHFWPFARVHRALDAMEALKLNVLHWHVVDSQSWPWAANATAPRPYCGACVYTSADVAAVAAAARDRGIAVVPELDAPGHGGAAPAAATCPELAATDRGAVARPGPGGDGGAGSTEHGLDALAAAAGAAHVHVGGDEVDAGCWAEDAARAARRRTRASRRRRTGPAREAALLRASADAARAAGATPVFWDDALDAGDPATLAGGLVQIWRGWLGVPGLLAYASTLGLAGAIVSDGMYLDYDHEGWDQVLRRGRLPDHALVVGGEACSWGEHNERLDARLVKLAAAAERLWGGAAADAARAGDLVGPRLRLSALRCHLLRRGHDATPPVLPDLCLAGPPRGPADAPPPASRAPAVVTIAAPWYRSRAAARLEDAALAAAVAFIVASRVRRRRPNKED